MSDTQGVVSQSPEPRAHDKSVLQYRNNVGLGTLVLNLCMCNNIQQPCDG